MAYIHARVPQVAYHPAFAVHHVGYGAEDAYHVPQRRELALELEPEPAPVLVLVLAPLVAVAVVGTNTPSVD